MGKFDHWGTWSEDDSGEVSRPVVMRRCAVVGVVVAVSRDADEDGSCYLDVRVSECFTPGVDVGSITTLRCNPDAIDGRVHEIWSQVSAGFVVEGDHVIAVGTELAGYGYAELDRLSVELGHRQSSFAEVVGQ